MSAQDVKPVAWVTQESWQRLACGGSATRGTVPAHAAPSAYASIPLYVHVDQGAASDGYVVLLLDKQAPRGYWIIGTYTNIEIARALANKNGKCEIRPVHFGAVLPQEVT